MIKRPLVWMFSAYLIGIYLSWLKLSFICVIILMLLIFLLIYFLMFRFKKKIIHKKDSFLWCMPLFLFLGFLSMDGQLKKPELYDAFDREIPCILTGKITMLVKKEKGTSIYVKNVSVTLSENDSYNCEKVIIYCKDNQNQTYNTVTETTAQTNETGNPITSGISYASGKSSDFHYLVGNVITVQGVLKKFTEASNPGQFNEQLYYQIENIDFKMEAKQITIIDSGYSKFHEVLGNVKDKLIRVYDTILSDKEAGTLVAMQLGEKYLLDDEIKELYQENGISHVLAISGLHVSLIGMFVFWLLKRLKCPVIPATFLTIFFIYSYGVLTNFSVSTNRAIVMMVILLLSSLFGKTYDMLSSIALSAFLILLQNPLQIMSAGFLLSYSAVLGIAVILPSLKRIFPSKNSLLDGLFISGSAQIATTPFILHFFYQFPLYSIFTNLIILPFVTVLTLTSILAGILGALYLPLGVFLIGGANYILKFYEWVCMIGSSIPGNLITLGKPELSRMLLYLLLIFIFLWVAGKYQKKWSILILVLAPVIFFIPRGNVGLEVTFLDVGQGDAIYMESRSGTTYLVDGGSSDLTNIGTYRLEPFLLYSGTDKLDYMVITHSDNDHISGLVDIMEKGKIAVNNLLLPYLSTKDDNYLKLENLAAEKDIPIHYLKTGDLIKDGNIQIICLHPSYEYVPLSVNSYSTVLSINYGNFDMLLTGDLQKDGEQIVLNLLQNKDYWLKYGYQPAIDYDILKVAHHGSRNSTYEDFLKLIKPEISIISCGKDNYYGHPHTELLNRLKQAGSDIRITYEASAVTITTDGKKIAVDEFITD